MADEAVIERNSTQRDSVGSAHDSSAVQTLNLLSFLLDKPKADKAETPTGEGSIPRTFVPQVTLSPRDIEATKAIDLMRHREFIISHLPAEQRMIFDKCRVELSTSSDHKIDATLRKTIDDVDPELAKINRQIGDLLINARLSSARPAEIHLHEPVSILSCHQQAAGQNRSEASMATFQTSTFSRAQQVNHQFLYPFEQEVELGKLYGVALDLSVSGSGITPEFYNVKGTKREPLSIAWDQPTRPQILRAIENKCQEIERTFPVMIARDREEALKRLPFTKFAPAVYAESPRLDFLIALEQSLLKSQSVVMPDNRTPKLEFFFKEDLKSRPKAMAAHMSSSEDRSLPASIALCKKWFKPESDGPVIDNKPLKMQQIVSHELVHEEQKKFGWDSGKGDAIAQEIGWCKIGNDWFLRGQNPSEYFKLTGTRDKWRQYDKNGWPSLVELPGGDRVQAALDNESMMMRAAFKPCSNYFDSPSEMFAEALSSYRTGGFMRGRMASDSPALYAIAQREDNNALDALAKRAGVKKGLIRLPSGDLCIRTPDAIKHVDDFEFFERKVHPWLLSALASSQKSHNPYSTQRAHQGNKKETSSPSGSQTVEIKADTRAYLQAVQKTRVLNDWYPDQADEIEKVNKAINIVLALKAGS
jgi:hypothetical protein